MLRFIKATEQVYGELLVKISDSCMIYDDCLLPSSCIPGKARMGFEHNLSQNNFTLYIDKNIAYTGENIEFKSFLANGMRVFNSYDELIQFIRSLEIEYANEKQIDISKITDISKVNIKEEQNEVYINPEELFEIIQSKIRGQDKALKTLCDSVVIHLAKTSPKRPCVIFAAGSTGTGKTETAKTLSDAISRLSGEPFGFLRLDMNEYAEEHRVSQLFGAPAGYIGYGDKGALTVLADNPKQVVLFDEIEKAHPKILLSLMNAMDAGRLSSPAPINGKTEIDCRRAIFIFTSNIPINDIETSQMEAIEVDEHCRKALTSSGIKPELAARVGTFLLFEKLEPKVKAEVAALAIINCATEYGITVTYIDPGIIESIINSTRSSFGARILEYAVDKELGCAFANVAKESKGKEVTVKGTLDNVIITNVED